MIGVSKLQFLRCLRLSTGNFTLKGHNRAYVTLTNEQCLQVKYQMLEAETILQNRYQLKQKLGDNPARQTWLAIDSKSPDNPQVVIKILAFGGQVQWENLKLFEREAQVLKQLNHPYIPKYRDYFCNDDRALWFALVEDYIPGFSLKELLNQNKRFTEKQVTKIATDILNILLYLHQLSPPVLHRDIKPSNLIMGEDEQVYLVDFGAVQDSAVKEGGTFTVVGTYGYTPIEQFGGRAVRASDLYALGATLIHLLTGIAPADLPQKDFKIHFSDKVSVSHSFVSWIEKLTEPSLEKRFSIVEQALTVLKTSKCRRNSSLSILNTNNQKIQAFDSKRIDLYKSLDTLIINIRPTIKLRISSSIETLIGQGLRGVTIILFIVSFLLIVETPFFGVLILAILLTITSISYYFNTTEIKFNFDFFEVKERFLGINYSQQKGRTLLIEDVSFQGGISKQEKGITLTTSKKINKTKKFSRFSFGHNLSDAELIWLAQEIRDWVQLQKQREGKH